MSIEVEKTSFGKILKITINGEKALIDGETYYVPDSYLVGLETKEIPKLWFFNTLQVNLPTRKTPIQSHVLLKMLHN